MPKNLDSDLLLVTLAIGILKSASLMVQHGLSKIIVAYVLMSLVIVAG